MKTTIVINTKGGVGKTTITTNLASYFAANNVPTTIMDYDPQGSSTHWLSKRPPVATKIHTASAAAAGYGLRSHRRYVPENTRHLIVDAPAGAPKLLQQEMLQRADHILIPVTPSAIDIHATANFIKELLLAHRVRVCGIRTAVVANRLRNSGSAYAPLERFLQSVGMPILARLADSDVFVDADANGVGIFEMDEAVSARERREFMPIVEWVRGGVPDPGKIVFLAGTRGTGAATGL